MTGEEVAKIISNYVNSKPTGKHEDFTKAILSDHKTLQQATMRLCFNLINAMAEQTYVDDRNKDAVEACKVIKECCGDVMHLRFI